MVQGLCTRPGVRARAHSEHLDGEVTDRRLKRLPVLYDDMLGRELPLEPEEHELLRRFAPILDWGDGWLRLYDTLPPGKQREELFQWFPTVLRRAVASAA